LSRCQLLSYDETIRVAGIQDTCVDNFVLFPISFVRSYSSAQSSPQRPL